MVFSDPQESKRISAGGKSRHQILYVYDKEIEVLHHELIIVSLATSLMWEGERKGLHGVYNLSQITIIYQCQHNYCQLHQKEQIVDSL